MCPPLPTPDRPAARLRGGLAWLAWLGGCGALAMLIACATTATQVESWSTPAITVNGDYSDWQGRFTGIAGQRSLALGVANDGSDLYLCIATRDLSVQSLLRRAGFTVWLDPRGGRDKVLGLRVAPETVEAEQAESEEATTPRTEIVFDGAEYGYQLAELGPDEPVDVKTAYRADVVVYEFRVALRTPLAAPTEDVRASLTPGPALGIGVVTGKLPPPEGPNAPRKSPIDPMTAWAVATMGG